MRRGKGDTPKKFEQVVMIEEEELLNSKTTWEIYRAVAGDA